MKFSDINTTVNDFVSYKKGVFSSKKCAEDVNHAVVKQIKLNNLRNSILTMVKADFGWIW
jgi:hypothetical protein